MPLSAGTRLGPHEIVAPIGAGGMGEVYRAKDTRLDRTVAIKILPEHFSSNARRHERFEREARAISALNHPNICTLHDIGHQDGIDYLVMEYVQGETLDDRLRKGPLPPDQVLRYAIQIADALTTAHRRGVIHRDLKPGNIMLTKSGAKLLDFGLAKVAETGSARGLTVLATETTPLTAQGSILGTLQYMAPEQLEGKDADARTDLFAFGAVLYEMVTGRKAFEGRSHASLIAAILDQDPPPISARQPNPVPALDRVVKKALAKDPDNRWQTAIDLKDELKWIAETESSAPSFVSHTKSHARRDWLARVALLIGLLAALWITFRYLPGRQTVESALRFSVPLPTGTRFTSTDTVGPTPQIAVSPDGRMITFAASYPGHPAFLWLRKLDSFEPQMLPGTEGASFPFWSQDSRFLGFFARGKLKKLDVSNPIPQVIVDAPDGRGGTWNRDGVIVFAEGISSGLKQVSAAGGIPIPATVLDKSRGELSHRFPQFLPDGRNFVYVNHAAEKHLGLYVGSLGSKETKRILTGKWSTAYAVGDYLISVREGTLIAHPFNRKRLEVAARQFSVAEQVASSSPSGFASFSASLSGVLVYASGSSPSRQLVWFSREGVRLGPVGPVGEYASPALAPGERTLAFARVNPQTRTPDIWLFDLGRGTETRFTFDPGSERAPLWSPDGREIMFASDRTGVWDLYKKSVNGTKAEEVVITSADDEFPSQWSADGRLVVYSTPKPDTNWDLWTLPVLEPSKPSPFLTTPFNEVQGALSPNGQWMAYTSDETGRFEVYVQSFPVGGNKWQVSVDGGSDPKWRSNGRELFYVSPKHELMSVKLQPGSRFEAGVPAELFEMPVPDLVPAFPNSYVATADGQRFLVNTVVPDAPSSPISVVMNWAAELPRARFDN